MGERIDLGFDHELSFTSWVPDRDLNPQYADVPDIVPCGAIIRHRAKDGSACAGAVFFDVPGVERIAHDRPRWQVENWEPLTLAPSVLCRACGDHGFVREGRWEVA